uniref:Uncharacterized protein n=1 Tax=Rhizochromulina marina TaxID=1034831 RepID=A0A7S2RQ87_9STRA|mmetsp:Transcript_19488/g.56847  ORF Transcript_19488/g.56847 Transcript_19488/m.56847 type:complete len:467 (+) Transcript_19488:90-1490(+)
MSLEKHLYRALMACARRADANAVLREEIARRPVDILQVAAAGYRPAPVMVKFAETAAVPQSMRGLSKPLRRRFMVVDEDFSAAASAEGDEVLAQHPEFTRDSCKADVYWDAKIHVLHGDGAVSLQFMDGDACTWSAAEAKTFIRRKHFVAENEVARGTPLLAVGGHYHHALRPALGPFYKWFKAKAAGAHQPTATSSPAWTLTSFCREAFRNDQFLQEVAISTGDSQDRFDKAFEALAALGLSADLAKVQASARSGAPPLWTSSQSAAALPLNPDSVRDPEPLVLAANGAFFAALQSKSFALMEQVACCSRMAGERGQRSFGAKERDLWFDDRWCCPVLVQVWSREGDICCIYGSNPAARGWDAVASFWEAALAAAREDDEAPSAGMGGGEGEGAGDSTLCIDLDDVRVCMEGDHVARLHVLVCLRKGQRSSHTSVTNMFRRESLSAPFKLVHHHSSASMPSIDFE